MVAFPCQGLHLTHLRPLSDSAHTFWASLDVSTSLTGRLVRCFEVTADPDTHPVDCILVPFMVSWPRGWEIAGIAAGRRPSPVLDIAKRPEGWRCLALPSPLHLAGILPQNPGAPRPLPRITILPVGGLDHRSREKSHPMAAQSLGRVPAGNARRCRTI